MSRLSLAVHLNHHIVLLRNADFGARTLTQRVQYRPKQLLDQSLAAHDRALDWRNAHIEKLPAPLGIGS